jgi:hypothetical protein
VTLEIFMAKISAFTKNCRPLVRSVIEEIKGASWKVYEDTTPKACLALKMYGFRVGALYPGKDGFSIGYWDAPAGRPRLDKWVRCKIRTKKDLPIHLAMMRARVIHILTGTQ